MQPNELNGKTKKRIPMITPVLQMVGLSNARTFYNNLAPSSYQRLLNILYILLLLLLSATPVL